MRNTTAIASRSKCYFFIAMLGFTAALSPYGFSQANVNGKPQSVKSSVSATKAGPTKAFKDVETKDDMIVLNLDHQGTSFSVKWPYPQTTPAGNPYAQQIWATASFTIRGGCNGWFAHDATFILNGAVAISVPWPAACPLPPTSHFVPIWMLETISSASAVSMSLDGHVFQFTNRQISSFKSFVDEKVRPDATWSALHVPYASETSSAAIVFAQSILDKHRPPSWGGSINYLSYTPSFSADSSEAQISLSGNAMEGSNYFSSTKTWTLRWSDFGPSANGIGCISSDGCVSEETLTEIHIPREAPSRSKSTNKPGDLFGTPYWPGDAVYFDFQRALSFLYYQAVFTKH